MASSRHKYGHRKAARTRHGRTRGRRSYQMRVPQVLWLVPLALVIGFGGVIGFFAGEEMRTSKVQADILSEMAQEISFKMEPGPTKDFRVPPFGPYNQRLGYSYLPFFIKALESEDYIVAEQARASLRYEKLISDGIYPIYKPKTEAGLFLKDRNEKPLYRAFFPSHTFKNFDAIPPLLTQTLLFVEDRELLSSSVAPTKNPVIEWDRFFYAALGQALKVFAPGINLGGGSTLATQIEKFRFSPGGQTGSPMEKIRQIVSGSLRVYMDGKDTREARKKIVLDYFNSTPLSARPGFGEINSIGDGFWAWFGRDLSEVSTALNLPETDTDSLRLKAEVYREALGLILAQRRPTYYLLTDRAALDSLTDKMLDLLLKEGVISKALRDATRTATFRFLPEPPPPPQVAFLEQKAANALRTKLLHMLGLRNLYELDRVDLAATSTLDQEAQRKLTEFLSKMGDPEHLKSIGLYGFRLLTEANNPVKIHWSVVLYEKGEAGNRLRLQADNIDGPFDMNEGVKLDLGSTAKLRTLVTYLEIIGELYRRYAGLSLEDLKDLAAEAPDVLTSWATTWLASRPDATLDEMLGAAMDRKYSASPYETFFTGGGAHTFVNFDKAEDHRIMDLREALRDSVNLVFVRLMRDIVNYTISQGQQTKQELLSDPEHPARKAYLERYADKEGATFLNKYVSDYQNLTAEQVIDRVTRRAHKGATSRTILFRSILPNADYEDYAAYMKKNMTVAFDEGRLPKLFAEYPSDRYNLADKGYITGINPMELWLVSYLLANPGATRRDITAVSKPIRLESYAWLFHKGKKGAQDTRIRILLELDAFARIQQRWARLGYPFEKLVPSYATSIGSSADRPGALAELVGILMNDGVRKPMLRFEQLHFAKDTPFETILKPGGNKATRVLDPAIARTARAAMTEVVENGTARRLRGAYVDQDGKPLVIGGKTGTGDHRYDEYGPGHRLISSRVVNRTGTIVFFIGEKFFGTVTAHVAGEEAGDYKFTSALSAQTLKSLAPILQPVIAPPRPKPPEPSPTAEPDGPREEYGPPLPSEFEQKKEEPKPAAAKDPAKPKSVAPKPAPKAPPKPVEVPPSSNDLMMDILPQ